MGVQVPSPAPFHRNLLQHSLFAQRFIPVRSKSSGCVWLQPGSQRCLHSRSNLRTGDNMPAVHPAPFHRKRTGSFGSITPFTKDFLAQPHQRDIVQFNQTIFHPHAQHLPRSSKGGSLGISSRTPPTAPHLLTWHAIKEESSCLSPLCHLPPRMKLWRLRPSGSAPGRPPRSTPLTQVPGHQPSAQENHTHRDIVTRRGPATPGISLSTRASQYLTDRSRYFR